MQVFRTAFLGFLAAALMSGFHLEAQGQIMTSLDAELYPDDVATFVFPLRKFRGSEGGKAYVMIASSIHANYLCLISRDVPWPATLEGENPVTLEFHQRRKPKGPATLVIQEDLTPPVKLHRTKPVDPDSKTSPAIVKWFDLSPLFPYWDAHSQTRLPLKGMTVSNDGNVLLRTSWKWFPERFVEAKAFTEAGLDKAPSGNSNPESE